MADLPPPDSSEVTHAHTHTQTTTGAATATNVAATWGEAAPPLHARSVSVSLGLKGVLADVLQALASPGTPAIAPLGTPTDAYTHAHTNTQGADAGSAGSNAGADGSDTGFRARTSSDTGMIGMSMPLSARRRASMPVAVSIPVIPETNESGEHAPDSPPSPDAGAEDGRRGQESENEGGLGGAAEQPTPTTPPHSRGTPLSQGESSDNGVAAPGPTATTPSGGGTAMSRPGGSRAPHGGNLRVALHRRRASTGGGPAVRSPMVSPMTFVTGAAQAAFTGPPSTSSTGETESGIASIAWSRRHFFFRKSSVGGTAADALAEAALAAVNEVEHGEDQHAAPFAPFASSGFVAPAGRSVSDSLGGPSARLRRADSAGVLLQHAPAPHSPTSGTSDHSAAVPMPAAALPPIPPTAATARPAHQRRRSSVMAYVGAGRRSSEASLSSVPEIMTGSPSHLEDSSVGGAASEVYLSQEMAAAAGLPGLMDSIANVVPPEHVEAALVGLVRVVNRFQAVFEADASGALRTVGSMSAMSQTTGDATGANDAMAADPAREGATPSGAFSAPSRSESFLDSARTADPPMLHRDSVTSVTTPPDDHVRRSSVVTESASDMLGSPSAGPSAFQVTITREDADMLAALVDVLTTAWNAGFYFAYAAAGGSAAANAAINGVTRDELGTREADNQLDAGESAAEQAVDTAGAAATDEAPQKPAEPASSSDPSAYSALASLSTRRASAAVGQILGITAEGRSTTSACSSPLTVGRAPDASKDQTTSVLALPETDAARPDARAHEPLPTATANATGPSATTAAEVLAAAAGVEECSSASDTSLSGRQSRSGTLGDGSRRALQDAPADKLPSIGAVPAPVVRAMALRHSLRSNSLVIPAGAPVPPSLMSATHRRRSSRVMAREELQRSFMANPAIFDEGTREYVAMLVAPQEPKRPGAAKDRFRSAGHKVAKLAALTKRTTSTAQGATASADDKIASPTATGSASKTDLTRRRSGVLPKFDSLARRIPTAEAYALAGMDTWGFDVFIANTKLLQGQGYLPPGDAVEVAAAVAATGGMISIMSPPAPADGAPGFPASPRPMSARGMLVPAASTVVDPVAVVESATSPRGAAARASLASPSADTNPAASDGTGLPASPAGAHASSSTRPASIRELEAMEARGAPTQATSSSVADSSGGQRFTDVPDTGAGVGAEMLVALASAALEQTGVVDELGLDRETLGNFLARIARGYHSQPYHNALHGADVCQGMFYVLTAGGLGGHLTAELRLAALLAAAVHDVGHPGVNNVFLSQTSHPLALTYNDRSPLENMHAATTFLTMRRSGCDVFAPLTPEQRNQIRGVIIDMVLATDNAHHFKMIGKIRRRLARAMRSAVDKPPGADDEDYTSSDDGIDSAGPAGEVVTHPLDMRKASDSRLVLMTTLHACDISNPARPWSPCVRWTDRITEEFWMQGDKLREASLAVPPMHDRSKPIPRPNMQAGFITALVLPLWTMMTEPAFAQLMNVKEILDGLKTNLNRYKDMIEQAKSTPPSLPAAAPAAAPAASAGEVRSAAASSGETSPATSGQSTPAATSTA